MKVLKRSGSTEDMKFDKVTARISNLCAEGNLSISADKVAQQVFSSMYDGMTTQEIDTLTAEIAVAMMTQNMEYSDLANRIVASNIQKQCPETFVESVNILVEAGVLNPTMAKSVDELNNHIKPDRDTHYGYFGLKTLEKSYLLRVDGKIVETPQYMWMRVALGIHGAQDISRVVETYDLMSLGYMTHATPTLFNSGTLNPQMSSCFLMAMKDDSIKGIYGTLEECAHISKFAGGIGLHAHNVRAKGSRIHGTNGTSDGIIPMLRVFNATARYVNQAGRRKGSFAIYLEPWHPDVLDFLQLRLNQGDEEARCRDLFTALWIPDLFMQRVEQKSHWTLMCPNECPGLSDCYGKNFEHLYEQYEQEGRGKRVQAVDVWMAILKSQIETGTPYMLSKDAANLKSNQKNVGVIKSSNLCVAPETRILTSQGYKQISTLEGQEVEVWNGEEFSTTQVHKTGENQKLIRVHTTHGNHLDCTPYHKFYVETGSRPAHKSRVKQVEAQDLEEGMKLIQHALPIIPGEGEMKYAYTHGMFCADGTYNNKKPFLSLYGQKKSLINECEWLSASDVSPQDSITLRLPLDLTKKFEVPINASLHTRLEWLAGYVDGDGCVVSNKGLKNIQFASINKEFLQDIQLMLQGMGVHTVVRKAQDARVATIRGEEWACKTLWRVGIDSEGLRLLTDLGFSPRRLDISNCRERHHKTNQYIKVEKVEDLGRVDDTYCFTEPNRHMGMFNGILTGQCTEIMEVSDPEHTAVCNLGSLALPRFLVSLSDERAPIMDYKRLHEVARTLTRNLNRVIDNNFYPVETARRSNMKLRPIGIGVQGLADVYMMMGLPFDSEAARQVNINIFETIYHAALEESCDLAREEGSYEGFEGSPAYCSMLQFDMWNRTPTKMYDWDALKERIHEHGLRNSLLLAPMPTATTAQILGNNEAFEPYTTNIYLRRTLAGEFVVVNKHLVRDLERLNLWSPEMKNRIIRNDGSVQGIQEIPEHLQAIYKTAWELSQKAIIDQAVDRGAYIDQSQSMNLFVEAPSIGKLSSMHMYSWKKGLKTLSYYVRTRAKARAQQVTVEPDVCETCSA